MFLNSEKLGSFVPCSEIQALSLPHGLCEYSCKAGKQFLACFAMWSDAVECLWCNMTTSDY